MRLLGVLFDPNAEPMSVADLADRADVAPSTASREVRRLVEHGIVVDRHVGRTRLVSANRALPWARDLQAMLAKTVGVPSVLSYALVDVDGVEEAWVYGSWAARYEGEPGPPPADIDLLVVGTAALRDLRAGVRALESSIGLEINPVVVSRQQWDDTEDAFIANVRQGPLVRVPLLAPSAP